MNRPKDDSGNPATLARLSLQKRQEQARNKEAASLACTNAKAQEREALNIFARLPLIKKLSLLNLAPPAVTDAPRRPAIVATLAQTIRQATDKTRKTENTRKDGESGKR